MSDDYSTQEMTDGYRDGIDLSTPEPSANRSWSYRHGFANGRDDMARKPRSTAAELRMKAYEAMKADEAR